MIMNRQANSRSILALLITIGLTASGAAVAQMGAMGNEQMQQMMQQRGYDPGCGMGMMGSGMGMMGGGGMMGSGMMGGGMMDGMGMMGLGPVWMLDLTDDQRQKINQIQDQVRKQHWDVMGKIMDEQAKLRDLNQADELDAKAIGTVYDSIANLRRQMLEIHIQSINQARALLSPEQREQIKQWRRGGWGPGRMGPGGMGPGGMGPGMNR